MHASGSPGPRQPLLPERQQLLHQQAANATDAADAEAGAAGLAPARSISSSADRWREAAVNALALKRVVGMAHAAGVLPGLDVKRGDAREMADM